MKLKLAKFIQRLTIFLMVFPTCFALGWLFCEIVRAFYSSIISWYLLLFIVPAVLAAANWWAEDVLEQEKQEKQDRRDLIID